MTSSVSRTVRSTSATGSAKPARWSSVPSSRTSATVEWSGEVGPEDSASSERSGTSGSSRLTLAASGAAMASRPPFTAEKCLRRVLISPIGAPEASSN